VIMIGAARRAGCTGSLGVLAALVLMVSACAPAASPDRAEALELANIRETNIVPKTSPARLVAHFTDYCVETRADPARVRAKLRAADYVEVPSRASSPVRSFVVDDSKPAVLLMREGLGCAVAAESRTGQISRIERMIASDFAQAMPVDPRRLGRSVERAWAVSGPVDGVIFVQRINAPGQSSRLILGIKHS